MKLMELFEELHGSQMALGEAYINSNYKLTILKGKINPGKRYYYTFDKHFEEKADVILTLGTDQKQYLIKL